MSNFFGGDYFARRYYPSYSHRSYPPPPPPIPRRRVFYSFHFQADAWRAGQVRNMDLMEHNAPLTGNDWEQVRR